MTNTLLSAPITPATLRSLADLAEAVATDGIVAHHAEVVAAVVGSDVAVRFPVLAEIAIDGTAPPIARERALGRLAAVAGTKVAPPRTAPTFVWAPRAA